MLQAAIKSLQASLVCAICVLGGSTAAPHAGVLLGADSPATALGQIQDASQDALRAPHLPGFHHDYAEVSEEFEEFEKDPESRGQSHEDDPAAFAVDDARRPAHSEGSPPRVRLVAAHPSRGPPAA